MFRFFRFSTTVALLGPFYTFTASAGSIYNPAEARSAALGGEEAARTSSVLSAMDANPAALASLESPEAAITLTGALLNGDFHQAIRSSELRTTSGFIASGAAAIPLPNKWPVRIGIAAIPDITLDAGWRYLDVPGGLGGATSYGMQTQESQILSLRTTAAVAAELTPWLSLGASAGAVYNHDSLNAPYIFQSQPVLAGFKTLLDLDVDGFAPTFEFGAQLRPTDKITVGLSYRPPITVDSEGRASGNASAQLQSLGGAFATVDPSFSYDAEVRVKLPQRVVVAAEWQAFDRLRLVAGIDWINWSDAFDELRIDLSRGSNAAINSVVGSDALTDIAPLRWRDQFVYRAGFEFKATDALTLRSGYTYGRSPVPNDTLTPLTGIIFEHTVTAGAGYRWGRYHVDLGWQWQLPAAQHVGQSQLLDGEYSNTSLTISAHLFQLTTGVSF